MSVISPLQLSQASTPAVVRVSTSPTAVTDAFGRTWSGDRGYVGGWHYATSATISGTRDPSLYRHERAGMSAYRIGVPNGTYRVQLRFAEIYWDAPGKRIFSVRAEGRPFVTNLDLIARTGAKNKAFSLTRTVPVTDGMLSLTFSAKVDQPKVSAISVTPAPAAAPTPTNPPTATPPATTPPTTTPPSTTTPPAPPATTPARSWLSGVTTDTGMTSSARGAERRSR